MKLDRRGILGMPMRLAVVFLVISISVPFVIQAVDSGSSDIAETSMGAEADKICAAAASVHYSGIGSSKAVTITIADGCELSFGDGSYAITMRYNGNDCGQRFVERPALMLLSDGIELGSGTYTVIVTSVEAERPSVEVSVA